jgi:hypothetical protein
MKENPKHVFDMEYVGRKLEKLCKSFIWSGIGLIAFFQIGMIFFRSTDATLQSVVFYSLAALSFIGLGCIICGGLMWRSIYGFFPNVKLRRDRTQKRGESNR